MTRAIANAHRIIEYSRAGRGVFARPAEELHPQLPLPPGIIEGTANADIYRLVGAGIDRINTSMHVWKRHRATFTLLPIEAIPTWSDEQVFAYFALVNGVLAGQKTTPDVRGWVAWYHTEFDPNATASQNVDSLLRYKGLEESLAGIAVHYLTEARASADPAYIPKADLHDVRFSCNTGELDFNGIRPSHDAIEPFVARRMRDTCNEAGVNVLEYKSARWAIARHHISAEFDRAQNGARALKTREILDAYPDLFDRLDNYTRIKGIYTHRPNDLVTDQHDIFN